MYKLIYTLETCTLGQEHTGRAHHWPWGGVWERTKKTLDVREITTEYVIVSRDEAVGLRWALLQLIGSFPMSCILTPIANSFTVIMCLYYTPCTSMTVVIAM